MATWAIGDLQGCLDPTRRLLDAIGFDPARDRLWFCGDLVNRGGESLETLRLVHSLRDNCVVTLGNHDLSLLAIAEREPDEQRKVNRTRRRCCSPTTATRCSSGCAASRCCVDRELGWTMVHAGLAPKWTISMAERHAREVEARLRGENRRAKLLRNMYGDEPMWSPRLAASNATARSSTCSRACATAPRGASTSRKGPPGTQQAGLYPWYEVPGRTERELRASSAATGARSGLMIGYGVHAIDTGAVWGGKLTRCASTARNCAWCRCRARRARDAAKNRRNRRRAASAAQAFVIDEFERELVARVGRMRLAPQFAHSPASKRGKNASAPRPPHRPRSGACIAHAAEPWREHLAAADHARSPDLLQPGDEQRFVQRVHRLHAGERHPPERVSTRFNRPAARPSDSAVLRPSAAACPGSAP